MNTTRTESICQEIVETRISELQEAGNKILSVIVHPNDFMLLLIEYCQL